jgi:hypothetical protein
MVYGDDIGLSAARARRAMAAVKTELGLKDAQAEFEGRGYVQSADVVNTGFVETGTSRVEVEVVYDELAALDDNDSLEITRLTREVVPQDPLALNTMRITVDGKPIDDPGKSVADIQRCTDVALTQANVRFKFDNLLLKPRLNVSAWPNSIRYQDDPDTEYPENLVRFRVYSNYPALITRSEIWIFEERQSERDTPLAVVVASADGTAEWQAAFASARPRAANSNTCCAFTNTTAGSTRPRRSRCGWPTPLSPVPVTRPSANCWSAMARTVSLPRTSRSAAAPSRS